MLVFDLDNELARIYSFLKNNNNEFFPSLGSRVDLFKYANKLACYGANIFVCDSGVDVGHAGFYFNDKKNAIAFLSSICVVRRYRGSKVAMQLLEKVIVCAKSEGMVALQLKVNSNNHKAIAFYHKHGFKLISCKNDINLTMKIAINGSK